MHSIFSCNWLDEVFQTDVTTDIVAGSNGLLNCEKASSEGRVERLQIEGEFVHDGLELGVPLVGWEGGEEGIETTESGDGGTVVEFRFQVTDGVVGDEGGEGVGGNSGGGNGGGCCRWGRRGEDENDERG